MSKLRIAFAGTPTFAATILRSLIAETGFDIVAVITQPDTPQGRKLTLTAPPVKLLAQEHEIDCYQPQHIKQIYASIQAMDLDYLIVAAYSHLIPDDILNLPKINSLNVHASLLPKYRGASVIQAPLLNGDSETGVSIIKMVAKLDAGDILAQSKLSINDTDTTDSLSERLAELGAELLVTTIKADAQGKIQVQVQNEAEASYCPRLNKADGLIDWSRDAVELERFVRAMIPWPTAWTWLNGKQLKIMEVKVIPGLNLHKAGKLFVYNNTLAVQTGQGALSISKIQPEGKNTISGQEFVNGYRDSMGLILG